MKLEFDFFPVLSPNFLLYAHLVASYLVATYELRLLTRPRDAPKLSFFRGFFGPPFIPFIPSFRLPRDFLRDDDQPAAEYGFYGVGFVVVVGSQ